MLNARDVQPRTKPLPTGGGGAALFTVGGFAAAFAAASCFGLPFALATLGLGSAWLTGLALLAAPYRPELLILGAVGLAGGALLLERQRRRASLCANDGFCARPAVRGLIVVGLLAGLALLVLGYVYG